MRVCVGSRNTDWKKVKMNWHGNHWSEHRCRRPRSNLRSTLWNFFPSSSSLRIFWNKLERFPTLWCSRWSNINEEGQSLPLVWSTVKARLHWWSLYVNILAISCHFLTCLGHLGWRNPNINDPISYPMLRMTHPSRNFFFLSLFCVDACL